MHVRIVWKVYVWLFYFIFSIRVKKTFFAQDGNEPENSLIITIVFAILIPGYFGYKHYSTVSNLKSISNDSYALILKAADLRDKDGNSKEAIRYIKKAASLDNPIAMMQLCYDYADGGRGVEKNYYTAISWCEESFSKTTDKKLKKADSPKN